MAYNGAAGDTKTQIATMLGLDGRTLDEVNQAALALRTGLESADPKFLSVFIHATAVPPFSLPRHLSRVYVLVPPDYVVARLWVRPDLAPPGFDR